MNESDFEAELRAVRPARIKSDLAERVAAELASGELHLANNKALATAPERQVASSTRAAGLVRSDDALSVPSWSIWRGLAWALGGAAAAVAVFLLVGTHGGGGNSQLAGTEDTSQPARVAINEDPDESVAELISTEDEGLILDTEDAQPQRQLRLTYLERHTWTNPKTGAVIEFEVPREDTVWMPVAMQ
jgi:hypothetical protein